MSHSTDCYRSYQLIDAFVRARGPKVQYATTEEILLVYEYHPCCQECTIKPDMLSKMTGRLYAPIWEEHVKRSMPFVGQQADIVEICPHD